MASIQLRQSYGPQANAVRKVNEKTDNNSTSIRELNSNLGEHFSEAERQIGTWMGKPLYRQCFHQPLI